LGVLILVKFNNIIQLQRKNMRIGPFGLPELLIILAILLFIFGARKLPEIGSSLGKAIKGFKSSVTETEEATTLESKDSKKSS
tara:strand:- start:275 stop:523 length:249 start_codon:yes stop_codon:yes gene_type:complete